MCLGCTLHHMREDYPWLHDAIMEKANLHQFMLSRPFEHNSSEYYLLGLLCLQEKEIEQLKNNSADSMESKGLQSPH